MFTKSWPLVDYKYKHTAKQTWNVTTWNVFPTYDLAMAFHRVVKFHPKRHVIFMTD